MKNETKLHEAHVKAYRMLANAIARKAGYGGATEIVRANRDCVISHVAYGYRKKTTT